MAVNHGTRRFEAQHDGRRLSVHDTLAEAEAAERAAMDRAVFLGDGNLEEYHAARLKAAQRHAHEHPELVDDSQDGDGGL